ncbi:MAG: DNA-binding response regulator [Candidatus Melainabacteria bacterium HGW-Melainabacteria-1]|nr:MAG: DNA-binding response regulator [Candidatus Melainabacteria bacterium HGW-Melainabacteria-1]
MAMSAIPIQCQSHSQFRTESDGLQAMRIHMIDDELEMHELLADYFADTPFAFSASATPEAGIAHVISNGADLVLLDLMLPGMDGFEVCRRLRAHDRWLPIVILTARKDELNKIVGLELGADDYLFKPFSVRELEARIKTILRHSERRSQSKPGSGQDQVLRHISSGLVLDPNSRRVTLHDRVIELTTTEFNVLQALMAQAGRVLSRDALINAVHGIDDESFDRTIDVMIYRLRQKLNDKQRSEPLIKTIRGIGYQFLQN